MLRRESRHLLAFDLGEPLLLEGVAWIASDNLLLDSAGQGGAEYAVNVSPGLRREPASLFVPPASRSPAAVGILDLRGAKLRDRQVSKGWDQEVFDDLGVALMSARSDLVAHRF